MRSLTEALIGKHNVKNVSSKYISDELYDKLRKEMYEENFELFDNDIRTEITAYPVETDPIDENRIFIIDLIRKKVKWLKSEPYEFKITYKIEKILGW